MKTKVYTTLGWMAWQGMTILGKRKLSDNKVKLGAAATVGLVLGGRAGRRQGDQPATTSGPRAARGVGAAGVVALVAAGGILAARRGSDSDCSPPSPGADWRAIRDPAFPQSLRARPLEVRGRTSGEAREAVGPRPYIRDPG